MRSERRRRRSMVIRQSSRGAAPRARNRHPRYSPRVASWPPLDDQLLADAAATFHWRLGVPVPLAITRDGAVLFRRTPPRGFASDLLGTDEEQLSDAERARRERTRTATRGVVDVGVSDDGKIVLVPLGDRLYLIECNTGRTT